MEKIKLIFGIGNPLKEYQFSYHNLGMLFLDFLKEKLAKEKKWKKSKHFDYLKLNDLILAKSKVMMNNSGTALKEILKKFKLKSNEVLVVQDDSDIYFNNFKIVFFRSSAGHKGIESIFKNINSKKIWRLRIGARPISLKGKPHQKAETFILKKISQEEIKKLPSNFEKIFLTLKNNNLNLKEY